MYKLTDFGLHQGKARQCGWWTKEQGECKELADPGWGYCKKHRKAEKAQRKAGK